jgi:hypothetical protein
MRRHGRVERGFARAALLAEKRENPHGVIIATSHHASKSCVDSVMASCMHRAGATSRKAAGRALASIPSGLTINREEPMSQADHDATAGRAGDASGSPWAAFFGPVHAQVTQLCPALITVP